MLRASPTFVKQTLWPNCQELLIVLQRHLEQVTNRVIAEAIHAYVTEAAERPAAGPEGGASAHG